MAPRITTDKIIDDLNSRVKIPGLTNAWTIRDQDPYGHPLDRHKDASRIKVMGDDLGTISNIAEQIAAQVVTVPGTLSAYAEKSLGSDYLDITINRDAIARYGLTINDVESTLAATVAGSMLHRRSKDSSDMR